MEATGEGLSLSLSLFYETSYDVVLVFPHECTKRTTLLSLSSPSRSVAISLYTLE